MNEKEAIEYAKALGTLKFAYMCDNSVNYETVMPKLIDGDYKHIAIELYIKEGSFPTVFSYDHLENMDQNYFQLAAIKLMDTETVMDEIYFSRYNS